MQSRYIKLNDGSQYVIDMAGVSDRILWLNFPDNADLKEIIDIFFNTELTKHMEAYFTDVEEAYAVFDGYTEVVAVQKTRDGISIALQLKEEE